MLLNFSYQQVNKEKKMNKYNIFIIGCIFLISGCATITTEKANLAEEPNGVRIYPQSVFLAVDEQQNETTLLILPDFQRAYDVKPLTILSKQEFNIKMTDTGSISELASNQDTTAILTFVKDVADIAAKAASSGVVSSSPIKGTFGLKSGLYRLTDEGKFIKQ